MAPSKKSSSTQSTLQVPSQSSSRQLRPPSPSWPKSGYIATPTDSRKSLLAHEDDSETEEGPPPASGPLANRLASPRPPTSINKGKKKAAQPAPVKPNAKLTSQGKVSLVFLNRLIEQWSAHQNFLLVACLGTFFNRQTCEISNLIWQCRANLTPNIQENQTRQHRCKLKVSPHMNFQF